METDGQAWTDEITGRIRAQLDVVLSHPLFQRASRQSAFLRYVVENLLDGASDALREHEIGVRVYGRKADYDTREDPIVRVEAARLRAKLREYYEGPGHDHKLRFELPKGAYTPRILGIEAAATSTAEEHPPATDVPSPGTAATSSRAFRAGLIYALAVLAIVAVAAIVYWKNESRPEDRVRSVAVLPFEDQSEAKDQESFCDGLTDQIRDELARVNGLLVAGRSSAGRFRDSNRDLRQIARQLQVTHVLEGSVRVAGERVRVTARLVDVQTGFQLWSGNLDRNKKDLLLLEDEIASALARALRVQLASRKEGEAASRSPQRLKAHNLFIEGRALHRKMNPTLLREAVRKHEEAVAADPSYALAHSGLAHVYVSAISSGLASRSELRDKAYAEARQAVELDPGLADGYAALLRIARDLDYDWPSAQRICSDTAGLISNSPGLVANCGILDMIQGRYDEAEEHFREVQKLDPLWSGGGEAMANLLAWSGRLRDAETQIRAVRSSNPDYVPALTALARILALQGRHQEALDVFDRRSSAGHSLSAAHLAMMAYLSARAGHPDRAKELERQLLRLVRSERVMSSDLALVRLGLNDHHGAVALLEQALDNREPSLGETLTDPLFSPLKGNSRFAALLRRVNL